MKKIVFNCKEGTVTEVELTDEELVPILTYSDWLHNYPLRIIAPKALALQYPNLYVWFMLNDLPMEKLGDNVHIYINEIMPEHQSLIDSLNGVITIEKRNG